MDPQGFGFLDPDPQKYADPRIRIKGVKYQNFFTPKTKIRTFEKKRDYKISSFLNGSSSFRIKICEKNKTKNLKIYFFLKNSVNLKEMTWIRIHFFQCGSRIRIKIKWILCTACPLIFVYFRKKKISKILS